MKTKIISLFLIITLVLSLALQSFASTTPFTDLDNISQKDKIIALQELGYVHGVGNNLFAPNEDITAAEAIQLIVNVLGLNIDNIRFIKEPKATDSFPKADNDAWYANALIIASLTGLDLPSDLDPNAKWTREEFIYHLVMAMEANKNLPKVKLVTVQVSDEDQINVEYSGAIQRALFYNIVELDKDGKFNPKSTLTRAEAAEQAYNALQYVTNNLAD